MRWSMMPVSVAAHAAALLVFLIVPIAADVDLPTLASVPGRMTYMAAAAMPTPPIATPPPRPHTVAPARDAAPVSAPDTIEPEASPVPPGPIVEGALPEGAFGPPTGAPTGTVGEPARIPPPPPPAESHGPLRVGGKISEPRKIVHVAPVYPPVAQAAKVEGVVVLEAVIDERGVVDNVTVLQSQPLLDHAAIHAVRQWRYTPTRLNGVPVTVLMTIRINFSLRH
jgi:periplasmic protein TonB